MNIIVLTKDNMQALEADLMLHFAHFHKPGVVSSDEIWADIEAQQRQGFAVQDGGRIKAVILTRVANDKAKSLIVTHGTGEQRKQWQHLFPVLVNWAKSIGCSRVEVVSRPGWKKLLDNFGLKQTHIVMEMDI